MFTEIVAISVQGAAEVVEDVGDVEPLLGSSGRSRGTKLKQGVLNKAHHQSKKSGRAWSARHPVAMTPHGGESGALLLRRRPLDERPGTARGIRTFCRGISRSRIQIQSFWSYI